ncbi:MAG: 3-oxoacyl-ACP reductase FabG [Burkholderiales bacterium]|nr:3-oxoacyl-ACP reductase FabG [Burkholderiales bacterium]
MSAAPELAGQVALVTGAAKNIGRAIALELAAAGARVAINTRTSRAEAEAVVNEIRAAGGSAAVYMADIADAAQVAGMHADIVAALGPVDILVLNASVRREIPFADMSFEEWRQVMSISLDGSFHCVKAVLPGMLAAGRGSIITLAGDTALTGAVGKVHSSSAKSGLVGMTRALARELGPQGIRVNCVSPGHFNTTRPAGRAARPAASGHIPLGRYGESAEVAATVRFLCGPGSGFITGQVIHVNGGQWMF